MPRRTSCSITMRAGAAASVVVRPSPLPPAASAAARLRESSTTLTLSAFDRVVHEITHLPADELADEPRVRQVEPERRHRREPVAHGAAVRARQIGRVLLGPADPVVRAPAQILRARRPDRDRRAGRGTSPVAARSGRPGGSRSAATRRAARPSPRADDLGGQRAARTRRRARSPAAAAAPARRRAPARRAAPPRPRPRPSPSRRRPSRG